MGRDCLSGNGSLGAIVSIHAPAWGATQSKSVEIPKVSCFNPRARMGRD